MEIILILADSLSRDARVMRWSSVFFLGVLLLLIFLVAAGVIIHFSRRYRQYLLRQKSTPTPSEDVWAMHRAPTDNDEQ